MAFRLTPQAEADIEAVTLYIAEDDPLAASRWFGDMLALCRALGETPGMGVARTEIRPGLRMFPSGSYLILYTVADDGAVEIVRVVHGARRWADLL